jgi:hypothetical protein
MTIRELESLVKKGKSPNSFLYRGKYYVRDNYGCDGIYLSWGSKEANKTIEVCTPHNRYNKDFTDIHTFVFDTFVEHYGFNYDRPEQFNQKGTKK